MGLITSVSQYYYRETTCKACGPRADDCVCWHDCGTGPFPEAQPDDSRNKLEWRVRSTGVLVMFFKNLYKILCRFVDGLVYISEYIK